MQYILILICINGLSYLATIYLGNNLDSEIWGQIANGISVASTIAVFSSLGRAEYDLREVSSSNKKIESFSIFFSLLLALFICFLYNFFLDNIDFFFIPILAFLSLTITFLNVPLKVMNHFTQLALIQKVSNLFKIFLLLFFLSVGYMNITIAIISFLFLIIIYILWHLKKYSKFYNFSFSKRWFEKEGMQFLLNELSLAIYYQSAIIIMGFYGMYSEIATYSLAILLVSGVALIINAYFNSMSLANFYKKYSINKVSAIEDIRTKVKICIILFIPLSVLLLAIVYFIYPLIFNLEKYPELQKLSILFIIPALFKLLYGPSGMIMNLKELIKLKNKIFIMVSIFCALMTSILVKTNGMIGAYIAFALSEFTIMVLFNYAFFKHKSKINQHNS